MKILVLYSSFGGSTEKVAKVIANTINADMECFEPVRSVPKNKFLKLFWIFPKLIFQKQSAIKPLKHNPEAYDLIFLGSPVWVGSISLPAKVILENGMLKNKHIAYFYCHVGHHEDIPRISKEYIEKKNIFIESKDFEKVKSDYESQKKEAGIWAKKICFERNEVVNGSMNNKN